MALQLKAQKIWDIIIATAEREGEQKNDYLRWISFVELCKSRMLNFAHREMPHISKHATSTNSIRTVSFAFLPAPTDN